MFQMEKTFQMLEKWTVLWFHEVKMNRIYCIYFFIVMGKVQE